MTDEVKKIKVLIIDDDQTIRAALVRAVEAEGFASLQAANGADGWTLFTTEKPEIIILDCLLPKMSGMDLCARIRGTESEFSSKIILISGIYKTPTFRTKALNEYKANHFLLKPFEMPTFIEKLKHFKKELLADIQKAASEGKRQIERDKNPADRNTLAARIQVQEIPPILRIFAALTMAHRWKLTGIMEVFSQTSGETAPISFYFSDGIIRRAYSPNASTQFGSLLVRLKYIEENKKEKLIDSLKNNPPIGEALVTANLISPHCINEIMQIQVSDRLTEALKIENPKIDFLESDINMPEKTPFAFDPLEFLRILPQEILQDSFITEYFGLFMMYPPIIDESILGELLWDDEYTIALSTHIKSGTFSFNSAHIDTALLRSLLFLSGFEAIRFPGEEPDKTSPYYANHLKELIAGLEGKNYFEVLELEDSGYTMNDLKTLFRDIAKRFHPDTMPANAPEENKILCGKLFQKYTDAYQTLSDADKANEYRDILEGKDPETILKAESSFSEGLLYYKRGQMEKARSYFAEAAKLYPSETEYHLYHILTSIMRLPKDKAKRQTVLQDTGARLEELEPTIKHKTYLYHLVHGYYFKQTGRNNEALTNFQTAVKLNPKCVEAAREARLIAT